MREFVVFLICALSTAHSRPQSHQQNLEPNFDLTKKITIIPFYGGAKGQSLQITEHDDGKVTTTIIKTPVPHQEQNKSSTTSESTEPNIDISDVEYPPLPIKYDDTSSSFGDSIRHIQTTALKIIKLQEIAKKTGKLTTDEETEYKENMDELNRSAQNLAKLQELESSLIGTGVENREGLSAWFDRKATSNKDKKKKDEDKKKKEEEQKKKKEEEKRKKEEEEKKKKEEEEKRKKEEEEKKKKEEEEKNKEEEEEEEEEENNDTVEINLPPEDASVAEAKPVGLAIAGEGGVAASKPIATAVVGPGGLAIARPVGTAIAGVAPDQVMLPVYAEGHSFKHKPGSSSSGTREADLFISNLIHKYHQV